jgi:DNA-binding transcriptional regulator PaaX
LITWKELLEALRRCDGQITDYGHPAGQILFDPAVGVGERIERDTFSLLCAQGWITTEDQGRIKRYRISETGITRLTEVESSYKTHAMSAA